MTQRHGLVGVENEPEFVEFYLASYRKVVSQVTAVTGDLAEAEDIAQEAFLAAAARWASVSTFDVPEAWVRRVAINRAISGIRRAARRGRALVRLAASSADAAEGADGGLQRMALVQALQRVPIAYRVVLALHYYADMSVADVAAELGLPEATVKTRLARGRVRLATVMRETAAEDVEARMRAAR